jgi:hypothetical protein
MLFYCLLVLEVATGEISNMLLVHCRVVQLRFLLLVAPSVCSWDLSLILRKDIHFRVQGAWVVVYICLLLVLSASTGQSNMQAVTYAALTLYLIRELTHFSNGA